MKDLPECLFSSETIASKVAELAAEIRGRFPDRSVVLLGILNGAAPFTVDLARALGDGVELTFVQARSYGKGKVSSGRVELGPLNSGMLDGATVVVVDTILDTGLTLETTMAAARDAGASEVVSCVLLDKPSRRTVDISADLVGYEVPDRFLVGYGLDFAGRYRALPYVGVLNHDAHV